MINFKPVTSMTPFARYKEAVARKREGNEKSILNNMESDVGGDYNEYQAHFDNNTIEWMIPHGYGPAQKEALLSLYGSQTKLVKEFRKELYKQNPQPYYALCPYCALIDANTTEHILPKDMYPEFAVNVLNLIPCCSSCNEKKGEEVRDAQGKKPVINFYTDKIPTVQFLYAEISVSGSYLKVEYKLQNPGGQIDAQFYDLIERHFNRLGLLNRYDDYAIRTFPQLIRDYCAERFCNEEEYDKYANKQLMKLEIDKSSYGMNKCDQVLIRAAATSAVFKQWVMAHPIANV
jgi:hypothetical protein